ncbi:hypothetical protein M1373_00400 [Candidatus Marsarchaeota archaeon]|nr:hypothetical protein [Candidatus Marsarchaeota archaeon]MCL5404474.1 hypothetical protein [Candidatus Marsarchaeota archaeon]
MKLQSALEMMSVYSWALLLIAIVVAFVFLLTGPFAPAQYLASTCNIQPLMLCTSTYITAYHVSPPLPIEFTLVFTNNLGVSIKFLPGSINLTASNIGSKGTNSYAGTCAPQTAPTGSQVVCTVGIPGSVEPAAGTSIVANFKLYYDTCSGSTCTGPYISTGTATTQLEPASLRLAYLAVKASPASGKVVINGISYASGVTIPFLPGNYTIYADAPASYVFSNWSVNNTHANVISLHTIPTKLVLKGNATLQANFKPG